MNDEIPSQDEDQEKQSETHSEDTEIPQQQKAKQVPTDISQLNFICYEDKMTILGASGSGKSYLANNLLQNLHGGNVYVWDFNFQFHVMQ